MMNKNLQSPTKLTEFAPLQPEVNKPQSVGQFISSFFKKGKSPISEETASDNSDAVSQDSLPSWAVDSTTATYKENEALSKVYPVDVNEGRSLPNVLRRISNLLALKSTNLQDYEDTDLKQYWMPDSVSKECYECSEKFTTFRRRHHCRVCGQIFCSQCCNQQIPGKIFGCTGDLRVCTYCCKVVLSYLQSSDFSDELSADLKILQENLQTKFGAISSKLLDNDVLQAINSNTLESKNVQRKASVRYQEETFNSESLSDTCLSNEEKLRALQNSSSLRNLFEEIYKPMTGVQHKHRHRLRSCAECMLGSDLVDWLIFQQKAKNRVQGAALCQALLEGGYIGGLSETSTFIDGNAFYKKGVVLSPEVPRSNLNFDIPSQEEPSWVQQIPQDSSTTDSDNEPLSPLDMPQGNLKSSSSYMLDLNIEANTVYLSRPPDTEYKSPERSDPEQYRDHEETTIVRPSEQLEAAPESGWFNPTDLREENGEKSAYCILSEAYEQHEQSFVKQLLASNGLSHSWADIITLLVRDIITIIRPDKNHDAIDLDIRNYVQFKILSGGLRTDTSLIGGIVCSKNVAHKGMLTDIENPKILLLQCSIVYQRTEGRLMSLEPVLMQEHEYLRHVSARIVALQPNVVLVQKNISRLAQDMLREHKITLVHNVKQSILERLARCTQADLVTAVDAHIGRPKLGTCKRFYLKSFNIERGGVKSLMFFEGLPVPHLGGTVLLRGASKSELAVLKNVSSLLLFTAYNWRLEKCFLMDEFAMPPHLKYEFLDDSKENSPEHSVKINVQNKHEAIKKNDKTVPLERNAKEERLELLTEGKKVTIKAVDDFTDPLHSSYDGDNSGNEKLTVSDLPFSNTFRKCLDGTILCISPLIMFSVPYLETEVGRKSLLRSFFPDDIYYSEQFSGSKKNKWKDVENVTSSNPEANKEIKPLHPFLTMQITSGVDSPQIQSTLAHFRACGGRYEKRENVCIKITQTEERQEIIDASPKDVLNPKNHQRLAVLFCSYSSDSNNAPAFCVNPWVVFMDFYGRNDIPLGCFLERYCFRSTYNCPSKSCDTPMVKHIRRFVHNSGCVSIYLNYFENEFSEDHMVMWTWCVKCQRVSPVVPMSGDTWSYSFAKYLELKFHGDVFTRRGQAACSHSLHHDHYQYFGYKNYVASFKYSSVEIWEISLPPLLVEFRLDTETLQNQLIDEVRMMAQKGHEIFSLILDKLAAVPGEETESTGNMRQALMKEQAQFKQRVEDVQLKLTSPTIENKEFEEKARYKAYWNILDSLVRIKRLIVETIETWNSKLGDTVKKKDSDKKKEKSVPQELDSPVHEEYNFTDNIESSIKSNGEEKEGMKKKGKSLDSNEAECLPNGSPKTHHRSQSDAVILHTDDSADGKKENDKKVVKNIFSHLLQSPSTFSSIPNPFNTQEHYTVPESAIPVVVYENEPSSIVAYTLTSNEYKKAYEELVSKRTQSADQSPSPVSRRRNHGDKEKNDEDKSMNLLGFLRNKELKSDSNAHYSLLSTNPENWTDQNNVSSEKEKNDDAKNIKNSHIEVQFQDSTCNFFCRVYLADKFATLRSSVLPIGEEGYIRSLARSVRWDARGGKSGSNFSKTADDRFILKEMSKSEVELFLESASNYFVYVNKCVLTKQPTLLGKIVGIYQIVFKNNTVQLKSWLLVMENLFYNRNVSQKFDLKGSMRNRLVVPENQEGEIVLLDENLMKMTCDSPLYVLPHSKSVLIAAIQNDTEFLCTQSVMDYSLLVGFDSENKELILGIIDYIRPFTWDKRLETFVKKRVLLGGQGKLPTIVSPEEYQKRFIEAMHRYFLEVPDHWAGLGKGLDL